MAVIVYIRNPVFGVSCTVYRVYTYIHDKFEMHTRYIHDLIMILVSPEYFYTIGIELNIRDSGNM